MDELLQRESSVPTWRRQSRAAASVGKVDVPAGASVLLRLTGTGGTADLAFGLGRHRCLGAGLARAEARIVIAAASRMLPDIQLAEPKPPMLNLLSFRAP